MKHKPRHSAKKRKQKKKKQQHCHKTLDSHKQILTILKGKANIINAVLTKLIMLNT